MINYSKPPPLRLFWDTTISYKRAWRKFWAIFQDEAIAYSRNHTGDRLGLHHLLFSAAEFQIIHGAAPQVLDDPGQAAGNATAGALANQAVLRANYNLQQDGATVLLDWLLGLIPRDLLEPMEVEHSMRTRSILYIVTTLRAELGVLTIPDIEELKQALRVPYVHPESVRVHINTLKRLFAELTINLQPVANHDAITIIKEGFPIAIYLECWKDFAKAFPALAQQTPAALYTAIIAFSENVLPLSAGPVGLGAKAAVATPPPGYIAMADVQVMIDKAFAAAKISNSQPSKKKSTAAAPGKMYCWSHGPEHTHEGKTYAHTSQDCKSPAPGHCKDATINNKMGGEAVPARYRYLG